MDIFILLVHLIFVQPNNEVYTEQEQVETIADVRSAFTFWHKDVTIRTSFMTTDQNVYDQTLDTWAIIPSATSNEITIYVVDNSQSKKLFFSDSFGGYAQDFYKLAVTQHSRFGAASLAHELGHVLYSVPDWYRIDGYCNQLDIMCDGVAAWNAKTIGCRTLAFIGTPCMNIYLPRIGS